MSLFETFILRHATGYLSFKAKPLGQPSAVLCTRFVSLSRRSGWSPFVLVLAYLGSIKRRFPTKLPFLFHSTARIRYTNAQIHSQSIRLPFLYTPFQWPRAALFASVTSLAMTLMLLQIPTRRS